MVTVECRDYRGVAQAIKDMTVRGAPAIGAAAAFGLALAARASTANSSSALLGELDSAAKTLRADPADGSEPRLGAGPDDEQGADAQGGPGWPLPCA